MAHLHKAKFPEVVFDRTVLHAIMLFDLLVILVKWASNIHIYLQLKFRSNYVIIIMLLKWILERQDGIVGTGLNWLRIGTIL
jgi:hypothetical protein